MAGNVQEKQLRWYNIALMSFITVWGFGNVVNNYANQGLVVVFSWVFIFALYFTPYALIVGQLGSTFKDGIFRCLRALSGICSSGCYRRSPKRAPLTNRA
ncbi:hypothetical protein BY87_13650 [Escherichia coli O157:H7 str. K5467]|nr:hypothetical protein BY87_13650 [Escherichia coli O157:H7 str. K5467]